MLREDLPYTGFSSICGFRHPLEVLEHVPVDKGGLLYIQIAKVICVVRKLREDGGHWLEEAHGGF